MSTFRLIIQSIFYYRTLNLAVLLGVIASTAVIAGALVVGDSVRGSLRQMSLDRLGRIDHVLSGHRFVREDLAAELAASLLFRERFTDAAPALALQGGLELGSGEDVRRAGKVNVFGIDDRAWRLTEHGRIGSPSGDEVILSRRAADQLGISPETFRVAAERDKPVRVTLWIELPSSIPRDSLLGERDETSIEVSLTVKAVLDDELGVARLELQPSQQLPLNAFVALDTLQANLNLQRRRPAPGARTMLPARVNAFFVSAKSEADGAGPRSPDAAKALTDLLADAFTLADLNLRIVANAERGYVSLESEQLILDDAIATAARDAVERLMQERKADVRTSPVLVYLANELANAKDPTAFSMYSIAAGVDFAEEPPFGPFEFVGPRPTFPLGGDQIVINEWLAGDLKVQAGDEVTLKYYEVGPRGEMPEKTRTFRVAGITRLEGTPAADRGLTPEVEGITDADTLADWDQPFDMDLERITDRDEEYWERYRATPKAFLSLAAAQDLWRSRYGELTSFRVALVPGRSAEETAAEFEKLLLSAIDPANVGLAFAPVKYQGLQAASGTTDFSGLFFGFSFFIILAAMILIGLLFRLGIERRGAGIGLLSALGFTPQRVRWLFLAEALIVVVAGGLLGVAAAVGYAELMVYGLKTWWIGAIGTRFLYVFVEPSSLATGFLISVIVMTLAVWWAMRQMRKLSARALLAGATEVEATEVERARRGRRAWQIAAACLGFSAALIGAALIGLIPAREAFMGLSWYVLAFFVVGIALLAGNLAALTAWLGSDRSSAVRGAGLAGLGRLSLRNATRHRQRSVLTVGLIAAATFVIVAVAAGRRNPAAETPQKDSGNGGFAIVAESSTPVLYDLNTDRGRGKLDLGTAEQREGSAAIPWDRLEVMAFRVRPGQDASCLNLYQTTLPTILGVTQAMIERGGFKFANTPGEEPWALLTAKREDGKVPVVGDMNTLMYSLHKQVGDEISVPDATNPDYTLSIVGMLDGSVLQGVLLMSEENFRKLYPERAGYQYFLIGDRSIAADRAGESRRLTREDFQSISNVLESKLAPYGFDAEPVAERLAAFLAVQNTYLSTFQALGGLGLLLGTFGLATVMLRNVLERRAELALFQAVGFRKSGLAWLVVCENAFLLIWGLVAGSVSALLAMTPHLANVGADVPWGSAAVLLGCVFLAGMAAALLAVIEAVRTPILATLRGE